MGREFFDWRLQASESVRCPTCGRDGARATGHFREMPPAWKLEVGCEQCGELRLLPIAEAELRRRVHERPDIFGVDPAAESAHKARDDDPRDAAAVRPAHRQPALLSVQETDSWLARTHYHAFELTLDDSGLLTHFDDPPRGRFPSTPVRHELAAPGVLGPLLDLLESTGLDDLPDELGRGDQQFTIARPGAPSRTLRWTRIGTVRTFGGDPRVTAPVVDLADGLSTLLEWIDAGGPAPAWPRETAGFFPHRDDLLGAVPTARLSFTHDWDFEDRHGSIREVRITRSGLLEIRDIDKQTGLSRPEGHRRRQLASEDTQVLFERLLALDPPQFRPKLGYVRTRCNLDRTHFHVLDWFDGTRATSSRFIFGSEAQYGVVHGDMPPTDNEEAGFTLLRMLHKLLEPRWAPDHRALKLFLGTLKPL